MNNGNLLMLLGHVLATLLEAPLSVYYSKSYRSIISDNILHRTRFECELRNRKPGLRSVHVYNI